MQIVNSNLNDITKIFKLYSTASDFMKSKKEFAWPEFSKFMILSEIKNRQQWKLLIEDEIAIIWMTTLNDELIWGIDDENPSLYIHRITVNPKFRGQNLVMQIMDWADKYCIENNLKYIRLDTVGLNEGLIKHYKKNGFDFLGTKILENVNNLPSHYSNGPVCLFQRRVYN